MNPNITRVYLLNVPLESDYQHTLYFTSREEQRTFFEGKVVKSYHYDDFSYQRKDGIMNVPMMYDEALKCNYVMYQNSAYNNKWFYAFITDVQYVNEDCTNIKIETDVMQTYLFDYIMKPSFVEREHVSNDTPGLHTQPEVLETGEYVDQVIDGSDIIPWNSILGAGHKIVLAVSENGLNVTYPSGNKIYNGVYSGLYYITFPDEQNCTKYIHEIQDKITEDIIYAAFIIPDSLADNVEWLNYPSSGDAKFQYGYIPYTTTLTEMKTIDIKNYNYLDNGYVPRNKKLLTFPYRYLVITNNAGSAHEYYYEEFNKFKNNDVLTFDIFGAISPGCAIKLVPRNYRNVVDIPYTNRNWMEGLDAGKLPTCGWTNDAYTNWLTQNALNLTLGFIEGGTKLVGGIAVGVATGGAGAPIAMDGFNSIAQNVTQVYQHSLIPMTAKGGVNQGDLMFASYDSFTPYKKSIKKEYAQVIDSYFDMYGYKINRVKMPNKAHRGRWWFTKTINANIDTTANDPNRDVIPQSDLQKIKDCYNTGITFWRNCNEIQNYSLSNGIAITDGAITD